jgi:hypothetical protein
VRDTEGFARNAVEKVAFDSLVGGEGDRMDQTVQSVPMLAELGEEGIDLPIVGDIAGINRSRAEFVGELGDTVANAIVLVGEGKGRAFTVAGLGNAVGD